MRRRRCWGFLAAACFGAGLAGGCDGDDFATSPGQSVMVSGVSGVVFASVGGGSSPPMPTAPCERGAFAYVMTPASGDLWWDVCTALDDPGDAVEVTPVTGSRTLSGAERASMNIALAAVTVSERTECGRDKAQWELAVDSASFHVVYGDDFYACVDDYQHFVTSDSLDHLLAVLAPLAR
jgi:hypothetical protein